jgi:hypothetical protein
MSSAGFDTLRADHPNQLPLIGALEAAISDILRRDPHALIDDDVLEEELEAPTDLLDDLLVELVIAGTLVPVALWTCPELGGTIYEAAHVSEFPDTIECDRCGKNHALRRADIEFKFLPSDQLRALIAGHPL